MRHLLRALIGLLLLSTLGARASEPQPTYDGLEPTRMPGFDHAWTRFNMDLSGYRRILLGPVTVAFSREFEPNKGGRRLEAKEQDKLKADFAKLVRESFVKELEAGGYKMVETVGEDVLEVNPSIIDLYVNAPDSMTPGVVRSYTLSTGRMTLVAELRDSASGEILARISDKWRDPERNYFELTTNVENTWRAREAATQWARVLRAQLDAARSVRRR